ncbi:MAG: N-acetylmuramoyl-L-alanine amidase [Chloroflexota bacterium]|nr:MAG: N-acetylmuramoyl-L-alanine amidase [Chloroflexota bacterium]
MPRLNATGATLLFCALLLAACAGPPPGLSDRASSPTPLTPTVGPSPEPTGAPHTVAIDPGHGGKGASVQLTDGDGRSYREGEETGVGAYLADDSILWEKTLTLDIAERLQRQLEEMGYRPVLTRTEDRAVNDPRRDVNGDGEIDNADELQARNDAINDSGAELFVSIHFNGYAPRSWHGITTYFCTDRTFTDRNRVLANLVHDRVWDAVASIGYKLHDNTVRDDTDAGGTPGHLALLGPGTRRVPRATAVPGVLIEPLFLTDPEEVELIQDPAVRQAIAQGLAQSIQEYFARLQQP